MDIQELRDFKLGDAIKFHRKLNPKLWHDEQLDPIVRKQLLKIAEDFVEDLGVKLHVKDITVSGSNAAFTYTPHSDLDLHVVVDMKKLPDSDVYRELFQAKKTLYNEANSIKVRGIPIELYVQDSDVPVRSLGEYSVLDDHWIKIPKKQKASFDQMATKEKYEQLSELVKLAMKTRDLDRINKAIGIVHRYREAGLHNEGEFSPENLAYKAIRKQGGIDKLYDLRDKLHGQSLSIEEAASRKDAIIKINKLKNMSGRTEHEMATSRAIINKLMTQFNIDPSEVGISQGTLGTTYPKREPVDPLKAKIAKAEYERQQAADALKGEWQRFKRSTFSKSAALNAKQATDAYASNEPDTYKPGQFLDITLKEAYTSKQQVIDHFVRAARYRGEDINLATRKGAAAWERGWRGPKPKASKEIKPYDAERYKNVRLPYIDEASGYIPSEKQKNDPRFKTALTVDVRPDAIKKNAKAFGFKTSRAGIPPQARADGKIAESLINEGMTFNPVVEKEFLSGDHKGEKYWSGSDWEHKVTIACRDCDGTGKDRDHTCPYCRGTGKEEETVSDAPELQVSNANGEEIQRMLGLDPDYSGIIHNKDLPNTMRRLIMLKNKGSQQHTQDASVDKGVMRRQSDDQGVTHIGRGATMYDAGRSQSQVDRYIDQLIKIIKFAQENNTGIGWG